MGWTLVGVGSLGFLHIVAGPAGFAPVDEIRDAGGYGGAIVAEPLRSLLAAGGAIVVLIAVVLAGALLITQTSLRTMATNTSTGVASVARPLARSARQALRELSSLSSDRDDDTRDDRVMGELMAGPDGSAVPLPPPRCTTPPTTSTTTSPVVAAPTDPLHRSRPRPATPRRAAPATGHCRPRPSCAAAATRRSIGPRSRPAARSSRSRSINTASPRRWSG